MKLIVDGFNMALANGTGIASYGRSFAHAAKNLGHGVDILLGESPSNEGVVSGIWGASLGKEVRKIADFLQSPFGYEARRTQRSELKASLADGLPDVDDIWNRPRLFRAAKGAFRRTGRFSAVRTPGVNVAHWTYPLPLFVKGARNIYTIHDIVPLKFPELASGGREYRTLCAMIAKTADHILTVSDCSRSDLIDMFGIAPDRITNTYQAIAPWQFPDNELAHALLDRWSLRSKSYFLFFGAIEPKKNLARLLEAFVAAEVASPLVIVSGGGWGNAREYELLARLTEQGRQPRILLIDYMSRGDLSVLVGHAKATIFPSLYEGFGLPALESMGLGTAVIASNTGALPEVVGQSGLMVDPTSISAIRDAIRLVDGDVAQRERLEQAGIRQARRFSMPVYQDKIADLLSRLSDM